MMARGDKTTTADDAARLDAVLYTGLVQGGFQAHAGVSPDEAVSRLEEWEYDEEKLVREESFFRLLDYFFADGWEPVALIRRVYCVARECFPELLGDVAAADVLAICDDGGGAARFQVVYRKLIEGWDQRRLVKWHEKTKVYSRGDGRVTRGVAVVRERLANVVCNVGAKCEEEGGGAVVGDAQSVSLVSLLRVADDAEWDVLRFAVFGELMRVFFQDGASALSVVRRVYAIAKALRPSLIGRMSLENMAWLCGDGGRATQSARVNRVYNWLINMFSVTGQARASFQKSASASERYRAAQLGNQNRSNRSMSSRGKMKGKRFK